MIDILCPFSYTITMKTLKQNVEQMIRSLPDDSTVEDIQYHLYVLDKIQKGQQAIRDGQGISHEEAKARSCRVREERRINSRGIRMDEYVEVFAASDITFAYLMKANLENAGIPVRIDNENLSGAYCLDGMVPRVLVLAEKAEEAKQIIEEIQQSAENDDDEE